NHLTTHEAKVLAFPPFGFNLEHQCQHTSARAGTFSTPHGCVQTPRFMPVGTLANVKTVSPDQLQACQAQMILANTYHLHIQPGEDLIEMAGGLHKFMHWQGPILTDSGGFQVFSLSEIRQINDQGVSFRSPRDGRLIHLSPEKSIEIQNRLGADVIMAFDECAPYPATREMIDHASQRTTRWLERCFQAHQRPDAQALFPIVQGGVFLDLRQRSAEELVQFDAVGYAIGGVSVGEPPELIEQIVQSTTPLLPQHKPRYLMGIGTHREMAQAVAAGIDLFDCVIPTRLARHGAVLTTTASDRLKLGDNESRRWNIKNAKFRTDFDPIDPTCPCYTCQSFSRAYLHHLFKSQEVLGFTLLAIHNLTELIRFSQRMRTAIMQGTFATDFGHFLNHHDQAH
ncbi:MAG: tRNA guanosine(34) transglycosylase Tgt, partial [Pseudanabaenaceae cyanobacterium bins.68]|nr:tRNA guanosine(34) transglycosylase Tgt [Pseudanabaenaceae cyanobacterium bins.68]